MVFSHYLFFLALVWDCNRNVFTIPKIGHPVTWYGVFFALGFLLGYYIVRRLLRWHLLPSKGREGAEEAASFLTDKFSVMAILGGVIGARLGHVLFYGWPYYQSHPVEIFKIWEGGLASHGGALGIFLFLLLFVAWHRKKEPYFTLLVMLDALVVAAALAGSFIRFGNFINQEILGVPTSLPWGIIFLHPMDGIAGVPLHPVQLYESLFYFFTFLFLLFLWKRGGKKLGEGKLSGYFFLFVFLFRFCIEALKFPQSELISEETLKMGQLLSIPFILFGAFLLISNRYRKLKTQS